MKTEKVPKTRLHTKTWESGKKTKATIGTSRRLSGREYLPASEVVSDLLPIRSFDRERDVADVTPYGDRPVFFARSRTRVGGGGGKVDILSTERVKPGGRTPVPSLSVVYGDGEVELPPTVETVGGKVLWTVDVPPDSVLRLDEEEWTTYLYVAPPAWPFSKGGVYKTYVPEVAEGLVSLPENERQFYFSDYRESFSLYDPVTIVDQFTWGPGDEKVLAVATTPESVLTDTKWELRWSDFGGWTGHDFS